MAPRSCIYGASNMRAGKTYGCMCGPRSLTRTVPGCKSRRKEAPWSKRSFPGLSMIGVAKITIVGVPDRAGEYGADLHGGGRRRDQHRHDRAERIRSQTSRTDISFTLPKTDGPTAMETLDALKADVGFNDVLYDDQIGKVSVIGGMRSHPGVSAKFFSALADVGVNIEMISTSEIRISVIVDQEDVDRAVVAAHTALGLDAAEEAVVYAGTGR